MASVPKLFQVRQSHSLNWQILHAWLNTTVDDINTLAGEVVLKIQRNKSVTTVSSNWGTGITLERCSDGLVRLQVGRRNSDGYELMQLSEDLDSLEKRISIALTAPTGENHAIQKRMPQ
jgi:hypothetical protein